MRYTPHLLEREAVQINVNQALMRHIMPKYGLVESDFREKHCWIDHGLHVPSKGLGEDGRCYPDDRIFYTWGRYEKLEDGVPKDTYPKIFLQVTVGEDFSCSVEEIERGVFDTAFAFYRQQEN